jgi:rhamnosyltransferase
MRPAVLTAIVTAYHPDARLEEIVSAALDCCAAVVVVDNTPGASEPPAAALPVDARIRFVRTGSNLGLAGALNVAVASLSPECDGVLFLDQDTVLEPHLVPRLLADLDDPTIGVVGPTPVEAGTGRRYERFGSGAVGLVDVDSLITSGMLARREVLDGAGPFRDEFFVDWVDNDYCLRLRARGVRIVRDGSVLLPHAIGQTRTHRLLGVPIRVIEYPSWRHYWVMRNGVVLVREHSRDFRAWATAASLYMARQAATAIVFGPGRRSALTAVSRGVADGLRGRVNGAYVKSGD